MPTVKTEGVPVKMEPSDEGHPTPSSAAAAPNQRPSFPQGSFSQSPYNQVPQNNYNMPPFGNGSNAFSMQLPQETQQMLHGSGMTNDPYWAMMMQGSNNLPLPSDPFSPAMQDTTEIRKGQQMYPSFSGLNSTLGVAPSDLDMNKPVQGNFDYSEDQSFFDQAVNLLADEPTPAGTPGVGGEPWSSFIDTERWEASTSSQ